jgi:tetratricopeptide (TPR) repeat protein
MTPTPEVQKRLRRYLLGQLTDDAREEVEKDLLASDEVFEELLVVEDEIIDDYVAGKLAEDEHSAFENHFLATPERQDKLKFGRAFKRYLSTHASADVASRPASSPTHSAWTQTLFSSPLRIGVLAIIVVGIAIGAWRLFFHQSDVDKGLQALNAAYRDSRPVEMRISDLPYAPYLQTRGGVAATDQNNLRLAELDFGQALKTGASSRAHHGLGKVYLGRHEFDKAIEQLNQALKIDSGNALLYNDLGIAWMEKGLSAGDDARLQSAEGPQALEYFNQALRLSPGLSEAFFDRAICYEHLGRMEDARHDWETYLKVDASSPWAAEARERLRRMNEMRP